jgi:hypothetical protein
MTKQFRCVRCGSLVTAYENQKTVTCPTCGQTYSNASDPPLDWLSLALGLFGGYAITELINFAVSGRAIATESIFGLLTEGVRGVKKVYSAAKASVEALPE